MHVAARQQRLITALAIHGPRPRSYLVGLLWPESRESRAMESLRVSMHLVSRQVPGLLVNGGAELSLSDLVDVDLHRVRSCVRELSQTGLNGNAASSLNLLRDAELLPGWYDDWVLFEQSRLRQDRLHAFHIIARESLARCDFEVALEASEAALELEPLYESAVGLLIRAQRHQGNNAAALRAFENIERSCTRTWALRRRRAFGGSSLTFCRRRAWRGGIGQVSNRQAGCPANGSRLRPLPPGREHN